MDNRPPPNPVPGDPQGKPWWNDQDKVGGMAATIVLLGAAFGLVFLFFLGIALLTIAVL